MLTDTKLRSRVDSLWDKFWTGGLANPLDAIEQFSYSLFLKQLEDRENSAERQAKRRGEQYQAKIPKGIRWSYWSQLKAEEALSHLKREVFPNIVNLAPSGENSSFGEYMKTVECKINRPNLLIEALWLSQESLTSRQKDPLR